MKSKLEDYRLNSRIIGFYVTTLVLGLCFFVASIVNLLHYYNLRSNSIETKAVIISSTQNPISAGSIDYSVMYEFNSKGYEGVFSSEIEYSANHKINIIVSNKDPKIFIPEEDFTIMYFMKPVISFVVVVSILIIGFKNPSLINKYFTSERSSGGGI